MDNAGVGNYGIEAWANVTRVHPAGLGALILICLSVLFVRRGNAVACVLVLACIVPSGQRVVVGGLDWSFLRISVLVLWCRVLARGEMAGYRFRGLDLAVVIYWLANSGAFILRTGSADGLVNRLGFGFDLIGGYFAFRMLVLDQYDLRAIGKMLAILSLPVFLLFIIESTTGRNMFFVMGGVPPITLAREGKLRCQGAFSHPILAGSFWASAIPLMLCAYPLRPWKSIIIAGGCSALGIVILSRSSTSVAALALLVPVLFLRRVPRLVPLLLWVIAGLLVFAHFARDRPVWHLLSRIDITGGSTGWHRYYLVDRFLANFSDWWMVGFDDTESWGHGLGDVTNQYVFEGVTGGLLGLAMFVTVIAMAFRELRLWWRRAGTCAEERAACWAVGSALIVTCAMFFSVTYFGQILFLWYLLLAAIGSMGARACGLRSVPVLVGKHSGVSLSRRLAE